MGLATSQHYVCSGSEHIWTYHLIFLCFSTSSLEDIRGNPAGGLWHLSTYWPCLYARNPGWPQRGSLLSAFLFAARRLRSHPRLGRSRGPMPDLWGWREQLRVRGGTFQQLASRGRYVIKRIQCSSHHFLFWEPLPQSFFPSHRTISAVLISLVGGERAV